MTILFGKLVRETYTSPNGEFHLYLLRIHGGEMASAVFIGTHAPKALKSVEYQLHGEWQHNPRYGRQFLIDHFSRPVKENRTVDQRLDTQTVIQAKKRIDPNVYGIKQDELSTTLEWWL
jgi:hypothetical protein